VGGSHRLLCYECITVEPCCTLGSYLGRCCDSHPSLIFFTRLRSERGDIESDLVLEEGKYKGVYSVQWLGLGISFCVYSIENASLVVGSVPEKQLTSSIGK
jgi:hypothetical protein